MGGAFSDVVIITSATPLPAGRWLPASAARQLESARMRTKRKDDKWGNSPRAGSMQLRRTEYMRYLHFPGCIEYENL